MSQKIRHKISGDFNKNHRNKYKGMDQITKHDGFIQSDDIKDWMFSKHRKHENFKPLF